MDNEPTPTNPSVPPTPPPPPPLITAPVAATPKRGRGWMILALVLLVLLAISVMMNLGNIASGFMPPTRTVASHVAGPRFDEVIREDNGTRNKIAILDVEGIIYSGAGDGAYSMVDVLRSQLRQAADDSYVKAVILRIDSPGGEVLASDEIYRAIQAFQEKSGKPVIASMGSVAASGGYYVAAPCRWIVANELTITGSIGVIMNTWNYRHLMDKVGVVPFTFKSGQFKDMLSGQKPPEEITAKEKEMIQALIDETYGRFKSVVAEGRSGAAKMNKDKAKNRSLISEWSDYADGRILSGNEAHRIGLVDELGNLESAVSRARELGKAGRANLIQYKMRHDFSDLFRLFGSTDAKSVKVEIGLEMPKLQAGKLYFIAPTLVR